MNTENKHQGVKARLNEQLTRESEWEKAERLGWTEELTRIESGHIVGGDFGVRLVRYEKGIQDDKSYLKQC